MFRPRLPVPDHRVRIHPLLTSSADECCAALARLIGYVGTLASVGILGACLWHELRLDEPASRPVRPGWTLADRSHPAFSVRLINSAEKADTYQIFRHPKGGRRDVLRWTAPGKDPVAELEIYRPGGELIPAETDLAAMTRRAEIEKPDELQPAGIIETKFGHVTLLRRTRDPDSCLGFIRRFDETRLQISGWSCQGDTLVARRAAIGCVLNRLVLLTAGNDSKLAETFAHAELKGGSCAGPATAVVASDWVTSAENPGLRGAI